MMADINEFLDYNRLDDIVADIEMGLANAQGGDERPRLIDHGKGNYIIIGYLCDDTGSRFQGKRLATLKSLPEKQVSIIQAPEITFDEETHDPYALSYVVGGSTLKTTVRKIIEKYGI